MKVNSAGRRVPEDAAPPKTQPAAPAQPKLDTTASSCARSNSTQAKAGAAPQAKAGAAPQAKAGAAPVDSLVDKIGAKFRGSGGNVGANGAPSTGIAGSAFPKDRKASQEITGVREVQRTANLHEVSSGVARLVDKPYTKVNSAGRSLNDIVDRVTDQPMDGGRR